MKIYKTIFFSSDNKQYKSEGTFGIALIGIESTKAYEIIIYKDKQNIITRAKLAQTFHLTRNNIALSFYDESKQGLLIRFTGDTDLQEFASELEKVGAKVIESIPTNTSKTNVEKPVKKDEHEEKDSEIHSDSSGAAIKANILSRMAKMGQQILPASTIKNSVSDLSDSDSESSNKTQKTSRKSKRPIPDNFPPKHPEKPNTLQPGSVATLSVEPVQNNNTSVVPSKNFMPHIQTYSAISPSLDPFNILLSENRTQNTEIRMNLSQMSSKMDEILWKINHSETSASEEKLLKAKIMALELKVGNLTKELQESIETNVDLERKIMELKAKPTDKNCDSSLLLLERNKELEELKGELKIKESAIAKLENEKIDFERFTNNFETIFVNSDAVSLKDFETFYDENKSNTLFLKSIYTSMLKTISEERNEIKSLENSNTTARDEQNVNQAKINSVNGKIESVMQELYDNILTYYDEEHSSIPKDYITKMLPKNIKAATNYIKQECVKEFSNNSSNSNIKNASSKLQTKVSEFSD